MRLVGSLMNVNERLNDMLILHSKECSNAAREGPEGRVSVDWMDG